MPKRSKTIKVTIDKSHLLTLGERMYVESIELIRELVNNAYDADATEVYVTVAPESIVIEDDGSGMDEKGLAQFFTVGSEEKRIRSVSSRFGRKRIGQFGIGKFAALAAADRFQVESRKGKWIYSVIFDREEWQKSESWELPIVREPATPLHHEGTKVTLTKLKKSFGISDVERCLKESVPLRAKKFAVFLNSKRITARYIPGRRFPISFKTMYGSISGEIVVAIKSDLVDKPGIECKVKQVLIKREFFNLDKTHAFGLSRITGEVNADFLPIAASRGDFIKDDPAYQLFYKLMKVKLEKVLQELKKESETKYLKKVTQELREVMDKIREALKLHPEFTPSGRAIALRRKRKDTLSASTISEIEKRESSLRKVLSIAEKEKAKEGLGKEREAKKVKGKEAVIPKPQVIKKIRIKKLGISVGIVPLDKDGPEVYSEGNLVYINSDHSLYKKLYTKKELLSLHLLRLITQEIVLMKKLRLPAREAYEMQSKLLTDAVVFED